MSEIATRNVSTDTVTGPLVNDPDRLIQIAAKGEVTPKTAKRAG